MRKVGRVLAYGLAALIFLLFAGIFWPRANAPLPSASNTHIINNVHIIDVVSGTAGPLQSVRIEHGLIAAIGDSIQMPDSDAIDGRGGYLVPGLWDMHSHSIQLSPQLHFPLQVANGVTGVRDMMGCPEASDSLIACNVDKDRWTIAADKGKMVSPRFVGNASYYFDDPAMRPAEAAKLVRLYAGRGADYLKIYDRLTRSTYFRIAGVSRKIDTPMVGHLPKTVKLTEAIDAGQTSFEHARLFLQQCFANADRWRTGEFDNMVSATLARNMVEQHDAALCDRLIASMAAKNVAFVPTHVTREEDARATDPRYLTDPRLDYADPLSLWAWKDDASSIAARYPDKKGRDALHAYFTKGLELTGKAHAAGVRILVGTDTIIGGFRMHDEMRLLVRAGLTPAEVLRAATLDAARFVGREKMFGSIAVGKKADILLLRKNPLDDVANMQSISDVFLSGHHYDRNRLDQLLVFTKRQANHPANMVKMLWGFVRSSVRAEI